MWYCWVPGAGGMISSNTIQLASKSNFLEEFESEEENLQFPL